jgi:hypothetical protein
MVSATTVSTWGARLSFWTECWIGSLYVETRELLQYAHYTHTKAIATRAAVTLGESDDVVADVGAMATL